MRDEEHDAEPAEHDRKPSVVRDVLAGADLIRPSRHSGPVTTRGRVFSEQNRVEHQYAVIFFGRVPGDEYKPSVFTLNASTA